MSRVVVETMWVVVVRIVVTDDTTRAAAVCVAVFVMVPVARAEQAAESRDAPQAVTDAGVIAARLPKAVAIPVGTVTTTVEEMTCN